MLLDTHLLIWAASTPEQLSSEALSLLQNAKYQLYFSAVNLWEITIKHGLGRQDFRVDPSLLHRGLIENGYIELVVKSFHCIALEQLPAIHKDPFDRMLVAQAVSEGMLLLTSDSVVAEYPGPIQLV
ncbi:MAG: type II toxin-antitoxin system VapC family toxin [Deltaproteobacteria bacterium]|nr:type II toxin-antitoxin system VapC family toxin [Deltaproteobacteria bacterium]